MVPALDGGYAKQSFTHSVVSALLTSPPLDSGAPSGTADPPRIAVISDIPGQSSMVIEIAEVTKQLTMAYGVSVVDLPSGNWYIREIGATTEAVGTR